jgi:hypothetical protein
LVHQILIDVAEMSLWEAETNYGLLAFGLILILVGAATNSIFVVIFGLFILLPALVTTRGRRVPPKPPPAAPPTRYTSTTVESQVPLKVTQPPIPEGKPPSSPYAPIFPAPFFPTLNNPSTPTPLTAQVSAQTAPQPQQRDEVLEMLVLLGLLRILSRDR